MSPKVALVFVSHSHNLAEGLRDLASQMAPEVHISVAGGLPDGGLGTSFDLIEKAIHEATAASGDRGVAVLTDLGSATMTVESVIDFAPDPSRLVLAEGPLVEGGVAAAVAAQQNEDLSQVVAAVTGAGKTWLNSSGVDAVFGVFDGESTTFGGDTAGTPGKEDLNKKEIPVGADQEDQPEESSLVKATRTVEIADVAGLHARPAAQLARMASTYNAQVMINGVNAGSVLDIMSLGKRQGEEVILAAVGPEAEKAVAEIGDAIKAGFDR